MNKLSPIYWRVFYVLWTPVRLVAGFLWLNEWIPLGRFGPWVLGASICRWPNRVKGSELKPSFHGTQFGFYLYWSVFFLLAAAVFAKSFNDFYLTDAAFLWRYICGTK